MFLLANKAKRDSEKAGRRHSFSLMEVINARSALLSNFEVLELLHELENEHLARVKTALRIKKEEEASPHSSFVGGSDPTIVEVSENVRTVHVEAIQYLSADYQPMVKQTGPSITQLVRDLAPYNLTKAEKLQIVNLAPTQQVDLYVIVEELEDRLGDSQEEILERVRASISSTAPSLVSFSEASEVVEPAGVFYETQSWEDDTFHDPNEMVFDDVGEGRGVEGDLDMEDD